MVRSGFLPWWRTTLNKLFVCSGDWASGVWSSTGVPGQEQSCAARTGFATCEDFVRNNGNAFQDACEFLSVSWRFQPWLIYMHIFQTGKSYHTSDTRRTRHDIHACFPSFRSSHPCMFVPCPQCSRSSQQRHEVQTAVFTSQHHSNRYPYHYRAPSLQDRLSAGHLYLTTKPFTSPLFSYCRYGLLSVPLTD